MHPHKGVQSAERLLQARLQFLSAKMEEMSGTLLIGTPEAIRHARENVLSATEAMLDSQEILAWEVLSAQGIDPQKRDRGHHA